MEITRWNPLASRESSLECPRILKWQIIPEYIGIKEAMLLPQHSKIMSYSERISTVRINIDNLGLAKMEVWGFPGDDSGKEPVCQCRRHEFDPWVRKILWGRAWQPTPVFLFGKPHGQRNQAGYSPETPEESDTTEVTWHTLKVQA